MAAPAAAISCPRRPWLPSRSRSRRSASTARCSRRSPTPRRISSCSGRCPRGVDRAATTSRAFALRLRPNQDFAGALEAFCRERGIVAPGSTAASAAPSARASRTAAVVEPFATELAISSGVIAPGAGGALEAELDIALVDYTGGLAEGRLDARRQSGADDDGAGAGGGGGGRLVARIEAGQVVAALRSPPKYRKQPHAQIGWVSQLGTTRLR